MNTKELTREDLILETDLIKKAAVIELINFDEDDIIEAFKEMIVSAEIFDLQKKD